MQEVMQTNRYTKKFGLELDREDAELLVQERKNSLREEQRVEFGEGILKSWFFILRLPVYHAGKLCGYIDAVTGYFLSV